MDDITIISTKTFCLSYKCFKKSLSYDLFLLMEIRLIKIIAIPAMILTYIFGFILIYNVSDLIYENYFLIKLLSVVLLTIFQFYLIFVYLNFKARKNI